MNLYKNISTTITFICIGILTSTAQLQTIPDTISMNSVSELVEAKNLVHNYQLDKAIALYLKIYQKDTTKIEVLKELESLYSKTSQNREALKYAQKLIKLQPYNKHYTIRSGLLYKKIDEHKAALNIFKSEYKNDTTNTFIITQIADTFRDMNNADSAYLYYTKACELKPLTSNLIKGADILLKTKKNKEALNFLESYYNKEDHKSNLLQRLYGKAQYFNDSIYDSYEIFNELYKNGDSSKVTTKFLGLSCWKISHYTKGEKVLENFIEKDTTDYLAYYVLGTCCKNNNKPNKSIKYLIKSLELFQPDPKTIAMIHKGLGESFEWLEDYPKAIENYNLIAEYCPENIFGEYKIAMIYDYEIKNKKKALQCYNDLLTKINKADSTSESQVEVFCKMRVIKLREEEFWKKKK